MDTTARTASSLHRDWEIRRGTRGLKSNFTPKKDSARGYLASPGDAACRVSGSGRRGKPRLYKRKNSGKESLIMADPALQGGRQFVHIRGRKVHRLRVKDGDAVASDCVPPHLDQQGLQRLGIVFLRCHAGQFLKRGSNRQ